MRRFSLVLFALGFRPFFLLAGIFAVILMAIWASAFVNNRAVTTYYGMVGWHSHEMIFGYASAVIAGFLLTAVRNWTGMQTPAGAPLAALSALWVAGRIMPFFPEALPYWLTALVDLLFLPALAVSLAIPLLGSGQRRNLFFVPLLAVFALANLLIHLEILGFAEGLARPGIFLALDLIILLIVIMGGRVIPFFTERALSGVSPRRWRWIEWLSIGSVIAFSVAEPFLPDSILVGIMAGLAALSNGVRLIGWYTERFWPIPLLWVLHLGYSWVVVGFCLKTLAAAGLVSPQFTIHAFTVGGIGVLTLGMMARVSLGHTGRPLRAAKPMAIAFALINLAAVARGLAPIFFLEWLPQFVALSAGLWILAFAIFLEVYTPILIKPRIDGCPG
ncbi:MAG: NnrS family protein [Deltaproteobacteria bacterium]|nr:NnrS family protein [Deltaproteobacteria bacterium]